MRRWKILPDLMTWHPGIFPRAERINRIKSATARIIRKNGEMEERRVMKLAVS